MEEVLRILKDYWGWFVTVGSGSFIGISTLVGLKIKQGNSFKKALAFSTVVQKEQKKANEKVLSFVDGVVGDYKEIKDDVKVVLKKVDNLVDTTDKKIDTLFNIVTLLVSLIPINSQVKLEIKNRLDTINMGDKVFIDLLDKKDTAVETNDILDDLISKE